jgi:hypothetical protein
MQINGVHLYSCQKSALTVDDSPLLYLLHQLEINMDGAYSLFQWGTWNVHSSDD